MKCFKTYDVRGVIGQDITPDIVRRIASALASVVAAKTAVIGADARATSPGLKAAMIEGLVAQGVNVIDIGMTGTEEVYFATMHYKVDLGIEVTASHNPIEFNGIKFVGRDAKPFSEAMFQEVKRLAQEEISPISTPGKVHSESCLQAYCDHLLSYIDLNLLKNKPIKVVTNAGNGVAGHIIDELENRFRRYSIPISFVKLLHEPDSDFPHGIPNPLLPNGRELTSKRVLTESADLGLAWDGDFDRCFFFDHKGHFIEGYYIVGLLARAFLKKYPKQKVIHDPRLIWNTQHIINNNDGIALESKTGHAFIKQSMREHDAIYGGEMSAHHYFRNFGYCDSGMIPWLLMLELMLSTQKSLLELVAEMQKAFPVSGELNYTVDDVDECLARVEQYFREDATEISKMDGLSMSFEQWRFNLRGSNTEPLLRLNVESKRDYSLLADKVREVEKLIKLSK